ncbi:hypothetical protein PVAND_003218 [Polypedilum vanderplanki]|uniref:Odorant receptor n=1 Tax=Polypedilum vanderplanki TaxID=319348 RepID=A0A9J6BUB8_POLVA|nr:hypothetical protein PVAND_003218 [Polypedilum vanderplanki]
MKGESKKEVTYDDFHNKFGNLIFGAGTTEGVVLPTGIKLMIIYGILFELMHINGIYTHKEDFIKLMPSFMIYVLIIQIASLLVNRLLGRDSEPLAYVHKITREFYEREEKNYEYLVTLNSTVERVIFAFKCYIPISIIFYHIPVITGWFVSIWKQEYIITLAIFLPYTDSSTAIGYLFNNILLIFGSSVVFIIYMARDMHAIFYPAQIFAMVEIFKLKMKNFGKGLSNFHKKKSSAEFLSFFEPSTSKTFKKLIERPHSQTDDEFENLERQLIDLIEEYEVYDEYLTQIVTFISPLAFTALSTNSIAIGLALLYIRLVSVPIGLAFCSIYFYQVTLQCIIGTVISKQNEKLLQTVCEFPWYQLSSKRQKIYLQFIHRCQNTTTFNLPIIGKINLEILTGIVNATYSTWNFLMQFY